MAIRLAGGFRFPTAFNADVNSEFNPFGLASGVPSGVQWGVGDLLSRSGYLTAERTTAGMRSRPASWAARQRRSPATIW